MPGPRPVEQPEFGDLPGVGVEEVRAMMATDPVQLVDVRPRHFVTRQQDIAGGAKWRDPEQIDARYMNTGHMGWRALGPTAKLDVT